MKRVASWTSAKCKQCGSSLPRRVFELLSREAERERKRALTKERRGFEKKLSATKAEYRKILVKSAMTSKREKRSIRRSSDEFARQQRLMFDQEFLRLKNAYQAALENIKQSHARHSALAMDELKMSLDRHFEAMKDELNRQESSNQNQVHDLRTWLEQEFPSALLGHVEQLDKANSEAEAKAELLASEISKADAKVAEAYEKIRELEAKLESRRRRAIWRRVRRDAPAEPYKEEPPAEPQQEILGIIREIARERERMNGAKKEKRSRNEIHEFAESLGSKVSARLLR